MNHTSSSVHSSAHEHDHATRPFRKAPVGRRRQATVLVGIEDPRVREDVAKALEHQGYSVVAVGDGYRVIEYIASAVLDGPPELRPNLIIVDSILKGCTGLSLVSGLRDLGWETPVIVLTPMDDEQTRRQAWEVGATGVFMTPFDVRELGVFSEVILQLNTATTPFPRAIGHARWDQPGARANG